MEGGCPRLASSSMPQRKAIQITMTAITTATSEGPSRLGTRPVAKGLACAVECLAHLVGRDVGHVDQGPVDDIQELHAPAGQVPDDERGEDDRQQNEDPRLSRTALGTVRLRRRTRRSWHHYPPTALHVNGTNPGYGSICIDSRMARISAMSAGGDSGCDSPMMTRRLPSTSRIQNSSTWPGRK